MTDFSLSLSTTIKPAKKFTVDGSEYDLLGIDHLSADGEAEVMALFARYGVLSSELDMTVNVVKGKETAARIKETRLTLLTRLTSLPREIAAVLPLNEQVRLLEAIEKTLTDEDAEAEPGSGKSTD